MPAKRVGGRVMPRLIVVVGLVALGFIAGLGAGVFRAERRPAAPSDPRAVLDRKEQEFFSALATTSLARQEESFQRLIGRLRDANSSSLYNFNVYRSYGGILLDHGGDVRDARLLEIGPGINLSQGLLFVMGGAAKYYGLDIYRDPALLAAPQYDNVASLYRLIAPREIRRPVEEILTTRNGQVEFDQDRVEYLYPRQSYDIPLADASLDYVFSNATLEHVADPLRTVEAIHRVLKRGGITAHQIDLRDHADFARPLEFLKVDAATWAKRYPNPEKNHLYMNRWRASDFRQAFEKTGLRVLVMKPSETLQVTEDMRQSLQPEFRKYDLDDLSVVGLLIVARKP